ncbi:hypothetical protein CVS40_8795 [Lucilia cuprina]|nr:hypothetical protein CVS40_8795 [Lucilia cuprina]
MSVTSKISDGIESLDSEEVEKPTQMAPTKRKHENQPFPQRRLDFRESNSNTPLENGSPQSFYPTSRPIKNPISVDKWDISFDGNIEKLYIDDFIFRIEYMLKYHNYSWQDLKGEFHKLLKGDAKDWYWLLVQQRPIESWDELKKSLRVQYGSIRSEYELLRDFEERRQQQGESIDDYFLAMRRLRARLRNPLPEYEIIRIIKRNLRQNISQIVYSVQVFSVEQLRDTCKEVERNYFRKQSFNIPQTRYVLPRRQVEEVEVEIDREKEMEVVEEIKYKVDNTYNKSDTVTTERILCWNCRLPGHLFTDCPSIQRNLFCYRCGLIGVVTPVCPNCSGNKRGGVIKTAESRSTQTTAEQQEM